MVDTRYFNRHEPTIKLILRDYDGPYDAYELDLIWKYNLCSKLEPIEDEL